MKRGWEVAAHYKDCHPSLFAAGDWSLIDAAFIEQAHSEFHRQRMIAARQAVQGVQGSPERLDALGLTMSPQIEAVIRELFPNDRVATTAGHVARR